MKAGYRLLGASLFAAALFPCAIDTSPGFVPHYAPEKFNKAFVRGELGILPTTLSAKYKLVAWRYLAGLPLDATEQNAAIPPPSTADAPVEAMGQWLQMRNTSEPRSPFFYPTKSSTVERGAYYTNCTAGAFTTAVQTLADRKTRYANPQLIAGWIAAQDQVFQNCAQPKPAYPSDPAPDMPPLAGADRMYQIAAAHFYAEDLDGAEQRFRAIAADNNSPWKETAAYMVARTLIREDSLLHKPDALAQAKTQLESINPGPFRDSAHVLLDYLKTQADPDGTLQTLAAKLAVPHPGADISAAINEGIFVLDSNRWAKVLTKPGTPEPFDWIHTLESHQTDYAIQRWSESKSELWLTAALMLAKPGDPAAPELVEAGSGVPDSSPAFDTVTFHAIRLMIAAGDTGGARNKLNSLLSGKRRNLDSVDNAFREERMSLATSYDDFLRWAPRRPIGFGEEEYVPHPLDDAPVLDNDSVNVFNYLAPLRKLAEAAESPRLEKWPRTQIATSAWTRAFILGDDQIAGRLTLVLAKAHPAWKPDLDSFSNAGGDAKRFAGAFLIARHSDIHPTVRSDFKPKPGPDTMGSDWWCTVPSSPRTRTSLPDAALSPNDRAKAAQEAQKIYEEGDTQTVLSPIVMKWAQGHPADPRVPEALYRLVRVTRYGCYGDPDNGQISKAAFDLLHKNYPDSKWAAQTPYWFN